MVRTKRLVILSLIVFVSTLGLGLARPVHSLPVGTQFNHIVVIAMENQNYGEVIGSRFAPFINGLAAQGSTISNYHSYGQNITGCSAGCYEALTAGQIVGADNWCPVASSPCSSVDNVAHQLQMVNLTWAAFCEDDCPRGADHFPFIGYSNICVRNGAGFSFPSASGSSCASPNFYDPQDLLGASKPYKSVMPNAGDSLFINYLNSPSPANLIFFTPTDYHNMHSDTVKTGDNYLHSLLVGAGGTFSNPNPGTVFSTSLFKQPGTLLYLWWDEYDPSPNLEYGTMIKVGYTSTGGYDEYDSLHTIEANRGLPYLAPTVASNTGMVDIFSTGGGIAPPSASLTTSTISRRI